MRGEISKKWLPSHSLYLSQNLNHSRMIAHTYSSDNVKHSKHVKISGNTNVSLWQETFTEECIYNALLNNMSNVATTLQYMSKHSKKRAYINICTFCKHMYIWEHTHTHTHTSKYVFTFCKHIYMHA